MLLHDGITAGFGFGQPFHSVMLEIRLRRALKPSTDCEIAHVIENGSNIVHTRGSYDYVVVRARKLKIWFARERVPLKGGRRRWGIDHGIVRVRMLPQRGFKRVKCNRYESLFSDSKLVNPNQAMFS